MKNWTPLIVVALIPVALLLWALLVHLVYGGKYWHFPLTTQDYHDDDIHQEIQDLYLTKLNLHEPPEKR